MNIKIFMHWMVSASQCYHHGNLSITCGKQAEGGDELKGCR